MLYRILSGIDQDKYYLIDSGKDITPYRLDENNSFHLLAHHYFLPPEPLLGGFNCFGLSHVRSIVNIFVQIYARAKNIISIQRREPTAAIVACTGDLADIPAGFLASMIVHIPFYAYIFDDFVYQWTGNQRLFAKLVSPFIFKHSAGIIGPNEFICKEYQRRYGVTPTLVRNPCDANELGKEPLARWPAENGKIKIIYTGAVYHANYDCFSNLIQAMESLKEYHIELHIYTAQTREQLESQGIMSKQIFIHSHISYNDILEQQRKADILFLPLAFESSISEVIRTSAPGKLGEYLASGRPVLAHIPANSFVADYCGKYDCAAIASQNSPAMLVQTIKSLITNENFRARIVRNALSQSQADFHPQQASEKVIQLLGN